MDPKHDRYAEVHRPGDLFWGIGIENETYLEIEGGIQVSSKFLNQRASERYSVQYWKQYKPGVTEEILDSFLSRGEKTLTLPLLVNGHTFTKCDRMGHHKTTYTKLPSPNPAFLGTTLHEDLSGAVPEVFGSNELNRWWCYDGDTIEFMTQQYYCATVEDVIEEFLAVKKRWMTGLQKGLQQIRTERLLRSPIQWPSHNYGLAVFLTNRRNVAIFNNGTYHINLTAPTYLDKEGEIADWSEFQTVHQRAARLFQWISPFLVARWGSPDVFAHLSGTSHRFPTGSQRLAASRYVSVGTYDTTQMIRGKLLTKPVNDVRCSWWHDMYNQPGCAYNPMERIGFDINFNKFKNHGLEFRIFDWFPEDHLLEVLRLLVWLFDLASVSKDVPVPQESVVWNRVLRRSVWNGTNVWISEKELRVFRSVLGCPKFIGGPSGSLAILDGYIRLWNHFADQFQTKGPCSSRMLRSPLMRPLLPRIDYMCEKTPRKPFRQDILRITLFYLPRKQPVRLQSTYRPFLEPTPTKETRHGLLQSLVRALTPQRFRKASI